MKTVVLFVLCCIVTPYIVADVSCRCNIPRIDAHEMVQHFKSSLPDYPVVIVGNSSVNKYISDVASREKLLQNYGDTVVELTSSNTYSHGKRKMTLSDYIQSTVDISSQNANETFYLFGNNYEGIWKQITDNYQIPWCSYCDTAGAKTVGLGGHFSGVSFHWHGPGFSEVLIGKKRWFLYPAELTQLITSTFSPNQTVAEWVKLYYDPLFSSERTVRSSNSALGACTEEAVDGNVTNCQNEVDSNLVDNFQHDKQTGLNVDRNREKEESLETLKDNLYECCIEPGELLYFPDLWMHATLNLDRYNVFLSVFLDKQLM